MQAFQSLQGKYQDVLIETMTQQLDAIKEQANAIIEDIDKQLKPVRGYMDGCFDMTHSGHYNAIR